ncbi:MAG: hypothetical protein PHF64_00380 [Methanoregula sp.]|nr:hypothetical protein [Methanoregula sp.]
MYLNQFSVRIPEGRETNSGYVEIEHGKQYTLVLRNDRGVACDAAVTVDGKPIGTFRIGAFQNIRLERMPDDSGRFTFYKISTKEFQNSDLGSVALDDLGLIRVIFTPAMPAPTITITPYVYPPYWYYPAPYFSGITWTSGGSSDYDTLSCDNSRSVCHTDTVSACMTETAHSAGGTGLSGHSEQEFSHVGALNYDYSQQTTIHLRLVEGHGGDPRPLRPAMSSTPVPPRVV